VLGRPTLPVSIARLASERTLSTPVTCWVMPMEYTMAAALARAYVRAAWAIKSAGTPLMASPRRGGYARTARSSASKFSVRAEMNSRFSSFSARMTCIMELTRATSEPGRWRR